MNILIDSTGIFQKKCGIQRYAECLIREILRIAPEGSVRIGPLNDLISWSSYIRRYDEFPFYEKASGVELGSFYCELSNWYVQLKQSLEDYNRRVKDYGSDKNPLWLKAKRELQRLEKDMLKLFFKERKHIRKALNSVSSYHVLYEFFPMDVMQHSKVAKFITIHDVIPHIRPDLVLECDRDSMSRTMKKLQTLDGEEIIITVSESSKFDICAFNPRINSDKVHVTYLAAAITFKPESASQISLTRSKCLLPEGSRYILSTSNSDPKKNMSRVIEGFLNLIESEQLDDLFLVLVGGDICFSTLPTSLHARIEKNRNHIITTGFLDDADVSALHSGAICFCFPSLYEGFGIPALEAMQCGAPVITSNVGSLSEICGDAALLVDPCSVGEITQAMLNLAKTKELRYSLSQKGINRAKFFSWEKCAMETLRTYEQYS